MPSVIFMSTECSAPVNHITKAGVTSSVYAHGGFSPAHVFHSKEGTCNDKCLQAKLEEHVTKKR